MNATAPKVTKKYIQKEISRGKQYCLVLLKRGDNKALDPLTLARNQEQHLQYLFTLKQEGILPLFVPVIEENDLRGICIFNETDKTEVRKLLDADPQVTSGRLTCEIYEWFGLPGDRLP